MIAEYASKFQPGISTTKEKPTSQVVDDPSSTTKARVAIKGESAATCSKKKGQIGAKNLGLFSLLTSSGGMYIFYCMYEC